ncbi:superfamily II DNA/RNA helicase required for DNA uptake (late competence protein) [Halobacteroides halobius DSM 5150]|uniref:Superfamily II DNA/RNA helicase required for DNA uptake (Late competence protein) n=1 Tax=Halobacteroides halobius (strain ATCC 35273 / DSM 5150 / MD-1) TaxID=748449 RepID=L0KC74_HALHC|nr:DEAD/DEAH box helicase [Halobacteroides halobius]AGB42155.1 superfamily II DNA/RNA helicase required for DNA uptake (late competence protein) [Halobacteroides halobius DSM 5150]
MQQPVLYCLADKNKYLVGLSTRPTVEAKFYFKKGKIDQKTGELYILTDRLSWGVADYIYRTVTTLDERREKEYQDIGGKLLNLLWRVDSLEQIIQEKLKLIKDLIANLELQLEVRSRQVDQEEINRVRLPATEKVKEVYQLVQGRRLYQSEIKKLLRQNQVAVRSLEKLLVYLKLEHKLEVRPSIRYKEEQLVCQRCGSQEIIALDCNYCYSQDYYCKKCLLMGQARLCRPLYLISAPLKDLKLNYIQPQLGFKLTALQTEVANSLLDLWYQDYNQAFVWAVCGAGKTEVTFKLIADVLSQGGKVLFAIPRKDVVVELAERLQEAFPMIEIKALYGGSNNKYKKAELVIATTHQLLRYYQAFDLVILDEMDAFPYQGSEMLQRAVRQARKAQGKLVYMTATPSQAQITEIKADQNSKLIKLSARYHGHPLPEPELMALDLVYDKEIEQVELPPRVVEELKKWVVGELAQVFIFLPSRKLVELVVESLQDYFPKVNGQSWVQGSHAQDDLRDEKRESFIAGEYPILVSTTIMERGITIEKANVLVLFADWDYVFDEQSLIQMAGRSGRSIKYPQGRVWLVGNEITKEMKLARDMIQDLNQEAARKGHLKCGETYFI